MNSQLDMLNEINKTQVNAELIYSANQVESALDNMADAINQKLAGLNPLVLCVLNGGIIVSGKLLTRLTFPLNLDSINASRYQNQTSGGVIKWVLKPHEPIKGRTLLIIDDILDEGITLAAIKAYCLEQGASAVYCAVLVDKNIGKEKPVQADFVGLVIEDHYLFGYGMDYKGYLRNASGIYACKGEN